MSRLIDADELFDALSERYRMSSGWVHKAFGAAIDAVCDAPTVDATPIIRGKWVDRYGEKYANHLYECSSCKEKALYEFHRDVLGKDSAVQVLSAVCPYCGARMGDDADGALD